MARRLSIEEQERRDPSVAKRFLDVFDDGRVIVIPSHRYIVGGSLSVRPGHATAQYADYIFAMSPLAFELYGECRRAFFDSAWPKRLVTIKDRSGLLGPENSARNWTKEQFFAWKLSL